MPTRLFLCVLVLSLLGPWGCGKKPLVEESSRTGFDRDAREQSSVSTSVSLSGESPEDQLREANRATSEGDFESAISIYGRLFETESYPGEVREEALYRLAMVHGSALNPARNYEEASSLLRRLLGEFPETKRRHDVETTLEGFAKQ